eukprot:TRINITY_DN108676_c0_g1_i1.p1 TRINITY_DN108676_c0_g1~~TRINITY_DN108676_c0_g1_i1.p1  ORF type:complete len:737 (+),score=134.06 TRINITY_DN108676_c0_g1_i1:84-2294(+)
MQLLALEHLQHVIYVGELLVVILLSLIFEKGQDLLKERLKEWGSSGEALLKMLECLKQQIMTLGFIGLLLFCTTKTDIVQSFARHIYPSSVTVDDEHRPLSESFENVHMMIFCVILTFIFQCHLLMYRAYRTLQRWSAWESTRIKTTGREAEAADATMDAMLRKYGYISASGEKLKDFDWEKVLDHSWRRLFYREGVIELLQWRAIRHEFMFPSGTFGTVLYKPAEPHFFLFHRYLGVKLIDQFSNLIDVSASTWAVAALMSFMLPIVLDLGKYWYIFVVASGSWIVFFLVLLFGVHVNGIYTLITPDLPNDPKACLELFRGTSAQALRLKHHASTADRRKSNTSTPMHASGASPASASPTPAHSPVHQRSASVPNTPSCHSDLSQPLIRKLQSSLSERFTFSKEHLRRIQERSKFRRLLERFRLLKPESHLTNAQMQLFLFGDVSPVIYGRLLQVLAFVDSIATSSYLLILMNCDEPWDWYQALAMIAGLLCTAFNNSILVPIVVSKLTVVTSIEFMKDQACCEKVMLESKKAALIHSLKILQMAQAEAKILRMRESSDDRHISKKEKERWLERYQKDFTPAQRKQMQSNFEIFDADNSGFIDKMEMQMLMSSWGMDEDIVSGRLADLLWEYLGVEEGIDLESFQVLMSAVTHKDSTEEEDMRLLFDRFDSDQSGSITIEELVECFTDCGVDMDEESIAELVFEVFRSHRQKLNREDFVKFMKGLEDISERHHAE